jgi:hypothetical protein
MSRLADGGVRNGPVGVRARPQRRQAAPARDEDQGGYQARLALYEAGQLYRGP